MAQDNNRWYNNKTNVILLLIFIFPVGLYALFRSSKFSTAWKIVTPIVFMGLMFIGYKNNGISRKSQKYEKYNLQDDDMCYCKTERHSFPDASGVSQSLGVKTGRLKFKACKELKGEIVSQGEYDKMSEDEKQGY